MLKIIIIFLGVILISSLIIAFLIFLGVLKDRNSNFIPDEVEESLEDLKIAREKAVKDFKKKIHRLDEEVGDVVDAIQNVGDEIIDVVDTIKNKPRKNKKK